MLQRTIRWIRRDAPIVLLFVCFTIVLTYPQIRAFATAVPYHTDPYSVMWRLGWIAHALKTAPSTLFDANIFYPARHTLGYADAMLFQGIVAAPFFWARINPVLIYNSLLFAAFTLSGYATFVLARQLTGNTPAAIIAGLVYAFAPYRFCHYMHLELQTVFWIPFALILIQRVCAHHRLADGVLLGVVVSAQLLSNVNLWVYGLIYLAVVTPLLWLAVGQRRLGPVLGAFAIGATLTAIVATPYLSAYAGAGRDVGMRSLGEVSTYSAKLTNYLSAPSSSRMYGWTASGDPKWADELNLFPGVLVSAFALVGVIAGRGRIRLAYVAGLAIAAELSRGSASPIYVWLFTHIEPFQAFRTPARFDNLVNLSLGVLSAFGIAAVLSRIVSWRRRMLVGVALIAIVLAEYANRPALSSVPGPSHVDSVLARRAPAVIVELPLQVRGGFWGSLDWLHEYQSLAHFNPMLNGFSGNAPQTFFDMRVAMASFPDQRSMEFLRQQDVEYVVVRAGLYEPTTRAEMLARLDMTPGLALEGRWPDGPLGSEALYRIEPESGPSR